MKCNVVEGTSLISIYNGLNYSTREVNRNFKIKVRGIVGDTKYNCLVGVYGLLNIVGCEMANKCYFNDLFFFLKKIPLFLI